MPEHGTIARYRHHIRDNEPPCAECREARNTYERARYQSGRAGRVNGHRRRSVPARILDTVITNYPISYSELERLVPDVSPKTLRRSYYRLLQNGELSVLKNGRLVAEVDR